MSRIGKKIITLPHGVEVTVQNGVFTVKGAKSTLTCKLHPAITVTKEADGLKVTVEKPEIRDNNALWGLFGSVIKNMVQGVTKGFEKRLEMNGIGFKAEVRGKILVMEVGLSHSVNFAIPEGVNVVMEKNIIIITGADKQLVGSVAANIRDIKPPEPYLGKGIKYSDEIVRRKAGKAATKAAA